MNRDVFRTTDKLVGQRAAEKFGEDAVARPADDDLGHVLEVRETQQLGGNVVSDQAFIQRRDFASFNA